MAKTIRTKRLEKERTKNSRQPQGANASMESPETSNPGDSRTIGVALERHGSEQPIRWKKRPAKPDQLEIWCSLYERDSCNPSKLRTGSRERVNDLHTTLRVIEKLHLSCSYQGAALMAPLVLNPAYGQSFEPTAIYRWHATYNHGVPKVRVLADRSIVLKFASLELLQKLKEQLLPILNH